MSKLPDPADLSRPLEDIHQEVIDTTKLILQEVLATPNEEEQEFRQLWLSDRAKDMFRKADLANFEGAPERANQLYKAFRKIARHDKRTYIASRVQEGEWARTKSFRKKVQMGSICVKDGEGIL